MIKKRRNQEFSAPRFFFFRVKTPPTDGKRSMFCVHKLHCAAVAGHEAAGHFTRVRGVYTVKLTRVRRVYMVKLTLH